MDTESIAVREGIGRRLPMAVIVACEAAGRRRLVGVIEAVAAYPRP